MYAWQGEWRLLHKTGNQWDRVGRDRICMIFLHNSNSIIELDHRSSKSKIPNLRIIFKSLLDILLPNTQTYFACSIPSPRF